MSMPVHVRNGVKTACLLLLCFTALVSPAAFADDAPQAGDEQAQLEKALTEALKTKVNLDAQVITFKDALKQITAQLDATAVVINPDILKQAGISDQTKVSLKLTDAPFGAAFDALFNQARGDQGHGGWKGPITPSWKHEGIGKNKNGDRVGLLNFTFEPLDTRVYDVREVLVPALEAAIRPGWGDDQKQAEREKLVEQLTQLMTETVGNPSHWTEKYHDTPLGGTLTELNGNLIIKTTPSNHKQVVGLLGRLGVGQKYQVSSLAHVILLDNATFKEVFSKDMPPMRWRADGLTLPPAEGENPENASDIAALSILTDEQAQRLIKLAEDADDPCFVTALPRMTIYNGQRAYLTRVTQTAYVSGYTTPGDGEPAEPTIDVLSTGVVWDMQGTVSANHRYVTLTNRLQLAAMTGPMIDLTPADAGGKTVQVPQIDKTEMNATASMPDRGWLLLVGSSVLQGPVIGEMDNEGKETKKDPAGHDDTRRVIFLVRPTILLPKEEQQPLFPGLNDDPEAFETGPFKP